MVTDYSEMNRLSPSSYEVGQLFNALVFGEVLPPDPIMWEGMRIADLSANNLEVTGGVAQYIDTSITMATDGMRFSNPLIVYCNDIAYENPEGRLAQRAEGERQRLNDALQNIQIASLIRKDVADLNLSDFSGVPVDLCFDRLGALWYAVDEGQQAVEAILRAIAAILCDKGVLVVDDNNVKNKGDPAIPTGDKLRMLFHGKLDEVLEVCGLDSSSVADFILPGQVKDESVRILILRKNINYYKV